VTNSQPVESIPPDLISFLRKELATLSSYSIPFWRRSRKSKHDTLRYILNKNIIPSTGIVTEFGVFKGVTINMIAKKYPNRKVFGFDSFEGFPDDGRKDWQHDFSLNGVLPDVPKNTQLIKGFFEETLPDFVKDHKNEKFAMLHIDCDIYSSTKTIFEQCESMIQPGCIIVFDELLHYKGFENHEVLAFYEYLKKTGRRFEWVAIRNKVLPIDDYLQPSKDQKFTSGIMKDWRENGYEQEVAVRIL